MRKIASQSNPVQFEVLLRKVAHEDPDIISIREEGEDEFFVGLTFGTGGHYAIALTEPELQVLGRVIQQRFGDQDPLIGQFFHTFKDGKLDKQGHVAGVVGPGYYLIEFFSWVDGEKNGSKVIQFKDMIDQDWTFYDDDEQWRTAGDEHMRRQLGKREANPFVS